MITDWGLITFQALQNAWQGFLNFIPILIGAILVFVIGWFISIGVGKLIAEILRKLKFNRIFERVGWKEAIEKAEIKVDPAEFIGAIFKWVLVIVSLQIAVGILGEPFQAFRELLGGILGYLPNVIVAALIFVVAIVVADILEKIIVVTTEGAKFVSSRLAGKIVKWAIWIFAVLAILQQLRFEAAGWIFDLIKIVFIGVVAMATIAFGLGGKDVAARLVEDLKRKFSER